MSEANGKVCCNCKHCIRVKKHESDVLVDHNECEITGKRLGYLETMCGWCRRWAIDHWQKQDK